MYMDLCVGFIEPFTDLAHCPKCRKSYGHVKVLIKQFLTLPIGPQLQALYHEPDSVASMHWLDEYTWEIFEQLECLNGVKDDWDDFCDRIDYLGTVAEGKIKEGNPILMMSVDGAQLYKYKSLNCWIAIWVILNCFLNTHYKKKYILPAYIIPRPNKPKNLNLSLFPGVHSLLSCHPV
ncbi:hypothetical protein F4604DRAFT_1879760 [Suillus subluteus]|nr:hypothetical protein F4604DRAFT_1879760 [Suillus subluteus]